MLFHYNFISLTIFQNHNVHALLKILQGYSFCGEYLAVFV